MVQGRNGQSKDANRSLAHLFLNEGRVFLLQRIQIGVQCPTWSRQGGLQRHETAVAFLLLQQIELFLHFLL